MKTQTIKWGVPLAAAWLLTASHVGAQEAADIIQPDRPDVTNGTRIVPTGVVQLELGGVYIRPAPAAFGAGSPFTVRVGVTDWLEVRLGADGLIVQNNGDVDATGFGNVQLGAKVRLWSEPGGTPVLSILPTINLPTADAARGLGSGDADYTIAFLTGADVYRRGHVDINYGVGAIGTGQRQPHFVQHLISTSFSVAVTDRWNPYAEMFWLSRADAGGTSSTSLDTGLIYELGSRFAIDGGVQFGVSGTAPDLSVFGGLSVILGGRRGLNGRDRKRAAPRPTRR